MAGTRRCARVGLLLLVLALGACATVGGGKDDSKARLAQALEDGDEAGSTLPKGSLGAYVRALGQVGTTNIVLMNGCEDYPGPALSKDSRASLEALAGKLPGIAKAATPHYLFLYPDQNPYHALAAAGLSDTLDSSYAGMTMTLTMGADTPLFTVFALLGQAMNRTFVADNSLAEARCGEMALRDVPVAKGLEAILKSARVVSYEVESTEEFVFLRSPGNANPPNLLLNAENLTEAQRALLEKRVDVYLPSPPDAQGHLVMLKAAETLEAALPSLSQQLGVMVVAEKSLFGFPVAPVVLRQVRVRTALDLLLRQWLVADFAYEFRGDRLLIRRLKPGETLPHAPTPATATIQTP